MRGTIANLEDPYVKSTNWALFCEQCALKGVSVFADDMSVFADCTVASFGNKIDGKKW